MKKPEAATQDIPDELMRGALALYAYLDKSSDTSLEKLPCVYDYLNEFSSFVRTFTSCSKGCSYCCSYGINITTFEAKYISLKTGIDYNLNPIFLKNDSENCSFLGESGECSIYDCRPMICRLLHTFGDPVNCEIGVGKDQVWYGSRGVGFSNQVYNYLVNWLNEENLLAGGEGRDIRFFFPGEKSST